MEKNEHAEELKKTIVELHSQDVALSTKEKEMRGKLESVRERHAQKMALQVQAEQEWMQLKHVHAGLQAMAAVSNSNRNEIISALSKAQQTDFDLEVAICETASIEAQKLPSDDLSKIIFDSPLRKEYIEKQKLKLSSEIEDLRNKIESEKKLEEDFENEDQKLRANFDIDSSETLDIQLVIDTGAKLENCCKAVAAQIKKIKAAQK